MDDIFVHLVSGYLDRFAVNDPAERNDGNIRRSPSDIDHHVPGWLHDRKSGSDCRSQRLFYQIYFARSRKPCRILYGPLLNLGNSGGNAHDHARTDKRRTLMNLIDEIRQHLLGHVGVIDDTVAHWTDRYNISGRPAQHFFGFMANRQNLVGFLVYRNDRRLVYDDPLASYINKRIGRSKINRKILRKEPEQAGQQRQWNLLKHSLDQVLDTGMTLSCRHRWSFLLDNHTRLGQIIPQPPR